MLRRTACWRPVMMSLRALPGIDPGPQWFACEGRWLSRSSQKRRDLKRSFQPGCTSGASLDNLRVEVLEPDAGVLGRELPLDADLLRVAAGPPGTGVAGSLAPHRDPSAQALPRQDGQLRLGDVQPAAVLRRRHQLQPPRNAQRLG